jgi:hypothetical protein
LTKRLLFGYSTNHFRLWHGPPQVCKADHKRQEIAISTVTGSRELDRICFVGLLALMVIATPRILVYYRGMPTKVSVVAISADGARIALETPESLQGAGDGVRSAERRIHRFAETPTARALTPRGGRLEWSLHYSIDSGRFDRVRIVSTANRHENH